MYIDLLVVVIIPPVHTCCDVIPSLCEYTVKDGGQNLSVLCKNAFQIQAVANEASAFWVTQIG